MIEHLRTTLKDKGIEFYTPPTSKEIAEKINELVDKVNKLENDQNRIDK